MIKTHYTIQLKFKVDHLLVNVHELNVFSLNVSLIPIFFINNNDGNCNNNYNYAADIPRGGSSCPLFPSCGIVVCGGRKIGILREKNPSEQQREPITNSTHMWRQVQESNPTHSSMRASTLTTAPYLFPHLIQFVRTVNSLKKPKGRGEGCSTPGLTDRDSL